MSDRGDEVTAEKLVRDYIPAIAAARGAPVVTRVATEREYPELLRDKLQEEIQEFLVSGDPEELADILEVVRALAVLSGLDPATLEQVRARKAASRGGFGRRLVLIGTLWAADLLLRRRDDHGAVRRPDDRRSDERVVSPDRCGP